MKTMEFRSKAPPVLSSFDQNKKKIIKFNPMLTILSFPQSHLSNVCFKTRFIFIYIFFHLRTDLRKQQAIIWKGNKTFHFRLTENCWLTPQDFSRGTGQGFYFISPTNQGLFSFLSVLFPVVCSRQWALRSMDERGQNKSSTAGVLSSALLSLAVLRADRSFWDRHWCSCCLSFPIWSVGLKLQKACNCLPRLLRGYLISLRSALKIKNSMQVLIIIITQTRVKSC